MKLRLPICPFKKQLHPDLPYKGWAFVLTILHSALFSARAVMLFALIPLPTIRSLLSKHVEASTYGKNSSVFIFFWKTLTFRIS